MKTAALFCLLFCSSLSFAVDQPGKSDALIEALKKATTSADPHVRAAAARALGDTGGSSATAQLINLLKDKDDVVSSAAADALAKSGDRSTSQALIRTLTTESVNILSTNDLVLFDPALSPQKELDDLNTEERAVTIIHALQWMHDTNSVGTIVATLNSPRIGIRIAAAIALGHLKGPAAVKPLLQILEDYYRITPKSDGLVIQSDNLTAIRQAKESNAYLRSAVIWALGEIGNPAATKILKRALEDDNSIVRDTAKEALDKISG